MKIFIEGVGVLGSGLNGWQASQAVLAGAAPYLQAELVMPPSDLLPSAERRRTGVPVKLALAVGCEAIANSQHNASALPTVFASSAGDGDNMHCIFDMLSKNGREVSPTRFHNSVHNAPSGYWSIATKAMASSTSIACFDASFAAGLIEAATQTLASGNAVVLIAYDAPYPQPLHAARPLGAAFGVALVLAANKTPHSQAVRIGTSAARSLPLLAVLAFAKINVSAKAIPTKIYLDYIVGNQLEVVVHPC
jgi:hypothetical protein